MCHNNHSFSDFAFYLFLLLQFGLWLSTVVHLILSVWNYASTVTYVHFVLLNAEMIRLLWMGLTKKFLENHQKWKWVEWSRQKTGRGLALKDLSSWLTSFANRWDAELLVFLHSALLFCSAGYVTLIFFSAADTSFCSVELHMRSILSWNKFYSLFRCYNCWVLFFSLWRVKPTNVACTSVNSLSYVDQLWIWFNESKFEMERFQFLCFVCNTWIWQDLNSRFWIP